MGNQLLIGVVLIGTGLTSLIGGVFVLSRKIPESVMEVVSHDDDAEIEKSGQVIVPLTSEEKGRKFEGWIVKKFNPAHFSIKDWRGDKHELGVYPESSEYPDLEIEFRLKDRRERFAVECKWRKGFDKTSKSGITWASERQIANYKEFQRKKGFQVYVVIGIGGDPDDPAQLFVVNLDRLKYSFASAEYLNKFRRKNPKTDFYYDLKGSELR